MTLSPEFQARLNAAFAAYLGRDPRYRYWECRTCKAQFHYTTERMGDGKFASAAYIPHGPGSRSGKPREWHLRDELHHSKRTAAKARALRLYENHQQTHQEVPSRPTTVHTTQQPQGDTNMPAKTETTTQDTGNAVTVTERKCPHCDTTYPAARFSLDKHRKDGLANWCRSCMKGYWTAKRGGDPEPSTAKQRAAVAKQRYDAEDAGVPATPKLQVVPPLPADDAVETPEGQAALKAAADAADKARRETNAAKRREQRAAAKAAAELSEQTL